LNRPSSIVHSSFERSCLMGVTKGGIRFHGGKVAVHRHACAATTGAKCEEQPP
jgi:hypothetical protein